MDAVVVYESLWGNTAAIARAIAEGFGPDAEALPTGRAVAEKTDSARLIVAGAPLLGFRLPTKSMRDSIAKNPKFNSNPPDLSQPSMATWLESLPASTAAFATFETRIGWSPGSSAKAIAKELTAKGCKELAAPEKFLVEGETGPLKPGELERARAWGAQLAAALR